MVPESRTITKKELVNRIADETRQTKVVVKDILQRFLDAITEELAEGNRIEFRDFGVFEVRERAPRARGAHQRRGEDGDDPGARRRSKGSYRVVFGLDVARYPLRGPARGRVVARANRVVDVADRYLPAATRCRRAERRAVAPPAARRGGGRGRGLGRGGRRRPGRPGRRLRWRR